MVAGTDTRAAAGEPPSLGRDTSMTSTNEHPWQSGPRELFQFAMNALNSSEEVNRRIAFLLVDVCVETTFRTFLGLPTRLSGSKVGHSDLRRYAAGNFHDLADGVGLAAAGKNGAGAITLTGTAIGDRLVAVFGAPTAGGALEAKVPGTDFEAAVTVADQIQQVSAGNLSAKTYVFVLIPAAA